MKSSRQIEIPGGRNKQPAPNLNLLSNKLNKIIRKFATGTELNIHFYEPQLDEPIQAKLYDRILVELIEWLRIYYYFKVDSAIISKFNYSLNAYTNIALYNYQPDVRFLAYPTEFGGQEKSITSKCANSKNKFLIVPSINNCTFHSLKRHEVYKPSFKGEDQTVSCIQVRTADSNEKPYAIIQFARDVNNENQIFREEELIPIILISEILEPILVQAEFSEIAFRRQNLIILFKEIYNHIYNNININIRTAIADLDLFAQIIFERLGLRLQMGDSLAIFLPTPRQADVAACFSEVGFGPYDAAKMKYNVIEGIGLTGNIIKSREYDYCIDHLNQKSESIRGKTSSKRCDRKSIDYGDNKLSFVGVPLGKGDKPHNRGALIINLGLPYSIDDQHNYIYQNYVEPLAIIATLLDKFIEEKWHMYFLNN